jgi:biotin synthase
LLRFETSNRALLERIHPSLPGRASDRFAILGQLRDLGYEVGSGVMVGIPGQTYEDLADDIAWFRELDLDMIGLGPFIRHPRTPLGQAEAQAAPPPRDQVPNSELMTYKVLALTRLVCPRTNIPSTTALATINKDSGRELGLMRGANVVMPNVTPAKYRRQYDIYPDKAAWHETAEHCRTHLKERIESIGRCVGAGRGDSPNYRDRTPSRARVR